VVSAKCVPVCPLHWKWSLTCARSRNAIWPQLFSLARFVCLRFRLFPIPFHRPLHCCAGPLLRYGVVTLFGYVREGHWWPLRTSRAVGWIAIGPTGMASPTRKHSLSRCFRNSDRRLSAQPDSCGTEGARLRVGRRLVQLGNELTTWSMTAKAIPQKLWNRVNRRWWDRVRRATHQAWREAHTLGS